jgi:hypothetical protein
VVVIFAFRQPLTRFLERANKISRAGIEAGPPRQEPEELTPSAADELLRTFDNALLVQHEDSIRSDLDKRNIHGPERERVLLRFLAAVVLVGQFDRSYSLIWGSQMVALQLINSAGASRLDIETLRSLYEEAAKREPETYRNYSFDQWLGFLVASSLITRDTQKVTIRLEGREFLRYVVERGYPMYNRG